MNFLGGQSFVFRASCFGYYSKGFLFETPFSTLLGNLQNNVVNRFILQILFFQKLRKSFLPTKFLQFTLNGSYIFELLKNPNLGSFLHDFLQHLCIKPLNKVIIYKSRGEQFLWNINWDLGWFWARWQYRKKNCPIMKSFWYRFFSCCHG